MTEFSARDDAILFKLGQIDSKLDLMAAAQAQHAADDSVIHRDAEARIKSLEASRSRTLGAASVVSLGGAAVLSWVLGLFHHP